MTAIHRLRVGSSGYPGGPGVNTFYGLDGGVLLAEVQALYIEVAPVVPSDVTFSFEAAGDIIEDTTGVITGSWTGAVYAPIPGSAAGAYAAPVGLLFRWKTGTIADGKRVRGRTFIVPTIGSIFNTSGQVAPATVAAFDTALAAFVASNAGNFVVWHRPYAGRLATAKLKARAAHPGSHAVVTGSGTSTKAVVLRSRRD